MSSAAIIPIALGNLVNFEGGGTPSKAVAEYWNGDIPWASVKDINGMELSKTSDYITAEGLSNSASRIVPKGNVIIPTRMALGRATINTLDVAINQDLRVAYPNGDLDRRYLLWFIVANARLIESLGSGATVKGITLEKLRELQVPLPHKNGKPDLDEQKRIAAILDKADAIRRKRQQALRLTDDFLRSVFLDMFGDPSDNPKRWKAGLLGPLVAEGPQNGLYKPASAYGTGTRILRIDAFYDGEVGSEDKLKRVEISDEELQKYQLHRDDVVINRVNSLKYLGKCAIVPAYNEPVVFESNMMRFSVDTEQLHPRFLVELLQSAHIRGQIAVRAKQAVNQASINQTDVETFSLYLPPIELQRRFAEIADSQLTMRGILGRQVEASDDLFSSLQQRAFRGEL